VKKGISNLLKEYSNGQKEKSQKGSKENGKEESQKESQKEKIVFG